MQKGKISSMWRGNRVDGSVVYSGHLTVTETPDQNLASINDIMQFTDQDNPTLQEVWDNEQATQHNFSDSRPVEFEVVLNPDGTKAIANLRVSLFGQIKKGKDKSDKKIIEKKVLKKKPLQKTINNK